jgi:membrane protein implicated in regulation of membrane protease activity
MSAWIAWIVAAVVLLSACVELATGRSRMRGLGACVRGEQPGRYWLAIALKVTLAGVIAVLAARGRER